jgi:hypothetical protein
MALNVLRSLSFRNASALWVMVAIVLYFSFSIPETFLAARTWQSLLDAGDCRDYRDRAGRSAFGRSLQFGDRRAGRRRLDHDRLAKTT